MTVVTAQQVEERTAVTALDHTVGLPGVDVAVQGLQGRQVVGRGFNQTFGTSLLLLSDYRTASIPSLRANLSHFITPIEEDVERVEVPSIQEAAGGVDLVDAPFVPAVRAHSWRRCSRQHRTSFCFQFRYVRMAGSQ